MVQKLIDARFHNIGFEFANNAFGNIVNVVCCRSLRIGFLSSIFYHWRRGGYRIGEGDEVFAETSEDGIFEGLARLGRSAIVSVSTVVVV